MLEAQIGQQASSSSTTPGRLPTKPECNPHEHYNYVTLKEGVEDPSDREDIPLEDDREIIMVKSKEGNDGGEPTSFKENDSGEILTVFPPKLPDPSSFSTPYVVGTVEIERALCDLGVSVSLMP